MNRKEFEVNKKHFLKFIKHQLNNNKENKIDIHFYSKLYNFTISQLNQFLKEKQLYNKVLEHNYNLSPFT